MYTLRKITKNNYETNINIGNQYGVVLRETNYEEFKKTFEMFFKEQHVADLNEESSEYSKKCYGFILGEDTYPLYKNQFNYIMTENGKTFSNLTYK